MNEKEKKKQWEQEERQLRVRIGQIQDDQDTIKREQRHLEEVQEYFDSMAQEDSRLFEELCLRSTEEDQHFFQECLGEIQHGTRQTRLSLDEQGEHLQASYIALVEKEDEVTAEQRAFWKRSEEEWD